MMSTLKSWAPESLAILSSSLSLLGLSVLLAKYDGQPIFDWHGLTLNAMVSVLSTASKGSLLLAVEGATSQWKWILFFRRKRDLMDFERIDEASRGPQGSLDLLWQCRRMGFACLGAFIIILSLALDPFSQQLVQYQEHLRPVSDLNVNRISRSQRYSRGKEFNVQIFVGTSAHLDFAMQSAILYGLSQPLDNVVQQLQPSCPSGNCTWEPFDSLAICSVCNDVSAMVESLQVDMEDPLWVYFADDVPGTAIALNITGFRLPNGLINEDNASGVAMTTFGTPYPNEILTMKQTDTLIWSMSFFKAQPDASNASMTSPSLPFEVAECGVYYCTNNYNSSVRNAILSEQTAQVTSAFRNPESWQIISIPVSIEGSHLPADNFSIVFNATTADLGRADLQLLVPSPSGPPASYNLSQNAVDSISEYFRSTFASADYGGSIVTAAHEPCHINGFYLESNLATQDQFDPSIIQALWSSSNVTETFAALAVSMTNVIRSGADAGATQPKSNTEVWTTYYRVQWAWISMHAAIFLAALVFLAITVQKGRKRVPVWKSSSLASLSFGARVGGTFDGMIYMDEIEKAARREKVKLVLDYDHVPLDDLSTTPTNTEPAAEVVMPGCLGSTKSRRPLYL